MDVDGFWAMMAQAGSPEELHRRLAELSPSDLADFEVLHAKAFADSYQWGLWGAAYVIDGGCSDDNFDYFRAYLISLGRDVFEAALADPDSLAGVEVEDGDVWEDWMSPTMAVVHARTGEYNFVAANRHPEMPDDPSGESWHEDDLPERFPRLSAKYE